MAEERMLNDEILLGLIKANSGGGGGGTTDYTDLSNKPQINGTTLTGNKSASDLGLATTTDLAGKQDTLTFDSVPTDGSTNPVESNGVYDALATKANASAVTDALALKQDKTDNNLTTTNKTTTGAINELKSGLTTLDNEVNGDATVYPYADVITIEDAVPANVADCNVKIEPIQDLHGYDKPWVGGAGKNKLPYPYVDTTKTDNGVTFTDNGDGIITTSGIATARTVFNLHNASENMRFAIGSYILSKSYQNVYTTLIVDGYTGGTWKKNLARSSSVDDVTFTIDYDGYDRIVVYLEIQNGISIDNLVFKPMLRLSTESDATFAPYTNICPISGHTEASVQVVDDAESPTVTKTYTIALGDTIYGGTVDFDSGVMTVDRANVDLGSLTWQKDSSASHSRFVADYGGVKKNGNVISDIFQTGNYYDVYDHNKDNVIAAAITYSQIVVHSTGYESDYDATQFKTAMDGHYACYELATPTTIQLTPQQIQLLKGQNTLTASTGQISVTAYGVSGAIGSVQTQANDIAEDVADVQSKQMVKTSETVTLNANGVSRLTLTFSNGRLIYAVVISTTATYLALPYITSDKTWAVKVVDPTDMSPIASEEVEIGYGYIPN